MLPGTEYGVSPAKLWKERGVGRNCALRTRFQRAATQPLHPYVTQKIPRCCSAAWGNKSREVWSALSAHDRQALTQSSWRDCVPWTASNTRSRCLTKHQKSPEQARRGANSAAPIRQVRRGPAVAWMAEPSEEVPSSMQAFETLRSEAWSEVEEFWRMDALRQLCTSGPHGTLGAREPQTQGPTSGGTAREAGGPDGLHCLHPCFFLFCASLPTCPSPSLGQDS